PMNAAITSPVPAKDNMGMDYIPVYADQAGSTIKVSPSVVNNLGIRTAPAEQGPLPREIDTVGYVGYNKALTTRLHTRAEGWVQNLVVRSSGERIHTGELLFTLYAPKLVTAEEEYLRALAGTDAGMAAASRQRLGALGIPDSHIEHLAESGKADPYIPYYAGQSGVVEELDVRSGQYVTPDTQLMQLSGFASVWVTAEVFEKQADWVSVGDAAELELSALPGKVFKGKVDFVSPDLDAMTRTQQVRLRFDNPGEMLKPGMFADARIFASPIQDAVYVPTEALIRTAEGGRVVVALSGGLFDVLPVTAGIESGGKVQILSGLKPGQHVVISGQFLLDSEEDLRGGLKRLSSGGGAP
ncbi:MAG TPA: efflux RND transporter periplasmic adaptor subunit, partial [Gammaproteobacteria bacterium]|nr:efflux RND transporter periplasmic adaptor subunit [Gammaproteobacteria bacterium]